MSKELRKIDNAQVARLEDDSLVVQKKISRYVRVPDQSVSDVFSAPLTMSVLLGLILSAIMGGIALVSPLDADAFMTVFPYILGVSGFSWVGLTAAFYGFQTDEYMQKALNLPDTKDFSANNDNKLHNFRAFFGIPFKPEKIEVCRYGAILGSRSIEQIEQGALVKKAQVLNSEKTHEVITYLHNSRKGRVLEQVLEPTDISLWDEAAESVRDIYGYTFQHRDIFGSRSRVLAAIEGTSKAGAKNGFDFPVTERISKLLLSAKTAKDKNFIKKKLEDQDA